MKHRLLLFFLAAMAFSLSTAAADGYDLWLRYRALDVAACPELATGVRELVAGARTPTLAAAGRELMRALSGLSGTTIPLACAVSQDGVVLNGMPGRS